MNLLSLSREKIHLENQFAFITAYYVFKQIRITCDNNIINLYYVSSTQGIKIYLTYVYLT